jgi:hypothetical protein
MKINVSMPSLSAGQQKIITLLGMLAIGAASLGLLLLRIKMPINRYDESLILMGSWNVMRGELPYRDFWTLYFPAHYYLVASVLKMAGASYLNARLLDVALRFILAVQIYFLARRFLNRYLALVPFALVVFWLSTVGFYLYNVFPSLILALAACTCLFHYLETTRLKWVLAAGLLNGLVTLVRIDFGMYTTIAIFAGLAVYHLIDALQARNDANVPGSSAPPGKGHAVLVTLRRLVSPGLAWLGGMALIVIPFSLYFGAHGLLRTIWEDAIVFPFGFDMKYRGLAPPPLKIRTAEYLRPDGRPLGNWLRYYLPLATYLGMLGWLAYRFIRIARGKPIPAGWPVAGQNGQRANLEIELLVVTLLGSLLMVQATGRYDLIHVLPTKIVFSVVWVVACVGIVRWLWQRAPWLVWLPFVMILYVAPALTLQYQRILVSTLEYRPWKCYSTLPQAGCVAIDARAEATVNYLEQNVPVNEAIYVGTLRHDQILTNDLSLYFLSQRPHASRYQELLPGVATSREVQERIVQDLQARNAQWIVLVNQKISEEPNLSSTLVGSTYLDEFIQKNFRMVANFAKYRVYARVVPGQ